MAFILENNRLVAAGPVSAAVFAIPTQDIEVPCRHNAMPPLAPDKDGEIGNDSVSPTRQHISSGRLPPHGGFPTPSTSKPRQWACPMAA